MDNLPVYRLFNSIARISSNLLGYITKESKWLRGYASNANARLSKGNTFPNDLQN